MRVPISDRATLEGATVRRDARDGPSSTATRLVTRPLPTGRNADDGRVVRLLVPGYDVADFPRVAISEVWQYGSDSTQVPERLKVLLEDLAEAALPEHREPVRRWLDVVCGREPTGRA